MAASRIIRILDTPRLRLRPFGAHDVAALARLAGDRRVADTMISVPHPFREEQARRWIDGAREENATGRAAHFALTLKGSGEIAGGIELRSIDREHAQAELSFWVAVPFQGRGYATEAGRLMLDLAFEGLGLNRVYAHHMLRNPASQKVLQHLGMTREGILRQRVRKWGRFEDVALLAILHREWAHAGRR